MDAIGVSARQFALVALLWLAVAIPITAQETNDLLPGETVEGEIATGETATWTFTAADGAVLTFRAEATSGDLDPVLTLRNRTGTALITNDDYDYPEGKAAMLEAVTLPRTGTYTVDVTGFGQTAGDYRLTMLPGYAQEVMLDEAFTSWEATGELLAVENGCRWKGSTSAAWRWMMRVRRCGIFTPRRRWSI